MTIKQKMYFNLVIFALAAFYLGYREMVMMYPDSISFLNLKM